MTKTKHTPGPWRSSTSKNNRLQISGDKGRQVCIVWRDVYSEANSRLIAAAPELLEEHKEWASLIGRVYLMIRQGRSEEAADLILETEVIDYQSGEPGAVSDAITKAEGADGQA